MSLLFKQVNRLKQKPRWVSSVLVAVLAAIVLTVFLTILPSSLRANESVDFTKAYRPVALNLLNGEGYTLHGYFFTLYPPGYPLLLAGVYGVGQALSLSEPITLTLFSIVTFVGSALLIYRLAFAVWGFSGGWLAALIWITYPFMLWLHKQPNSELPFMILLYGAVHLLWRLRRQSALSPRTMTLFLVLGAMIGYGMLIRPISIGLGVVFAGLVWLMQTEWTTRMKLLASTYILIGNFLVVAPWQYTLYSQTQQPILLGSIGTRAMRDGLTFAVRLRGYRQGVTIPENVEALMWRLNEQYNELDSLGGIVSAMWEELKTDPQAVVTLYSMKAARSWYGTDSQRYDRPILFIQLFYIAGIVTSLILAWRHDQQSQRFVTIAVVISLYFWLMTTIGYTSLRYMTPAIGLLLCCLPILFVRNSGTSAPQ